MRHTYKVSVLCREQASHFDAWIRLAFPKCSTTSEKTEDDPGWGCCPGLPCPLPALPSVLGSFASRSASALLLILLFPEREMEWFDQRVCSSAGQLSGIFRLQL